MMAVVPPVGDISYSAEIKRKLIHLSSLWMPVAIYFLPPHVAALIFTSVLVKILLFEVLRKQNHIVARLLNKIFGSILRPEETGAGFHLTGATYVLFSAIICTLVFPKQIAVTAMSIMLVADATASLVGKKYGKNPIMGKSLEGSTAFLCAAFITVAVIGLLGGYAAPFYVSALVAAIAATAVELFSKIVRLDDNFSIPLVAGSVMWLVMLLT